MTEWWAGEIEQMLTEKRDARGAEQRSEREQDRVNASAIQVD